MLDAIVLQMLNGLDKGGAYALIALGLTLVFGTLGVVNFAHGALFMLGAFCAVAFEQVLTLSTKVKDPSVTFFEAYKELPYLKIWFGDFGQTIIDYAVPLSILFAIPVMLLIGLAMERGLIQFFYKRPHAEQILVTFGLAIVLQEIVKALLGANPIPIGAPPLLAGSADVGAWLGLGTGVVYPWWRLVYLAFSVVVIAAVFAFLQFTTFGMVVRAGMRDRETVGFLGINIQPASPSSSASPPSSPASPASCTRRSCRRATTWAWSSWCSPSSWSSSAAWARSAAPSSPASCSACCSPSPR